MSKFVLGLAGAAVLVVLFFVFRPGDDDGDGAATTTTTPKTGRTTTTTPTQTTPRQTTIRITVRGGRVPGGIRRAMLDRGERVVLVVNADISDEVHLHGYDIMRDVSPGTPARLRFHATIPGRFEVELEERHLQIAQLEVRP